MIVWDAMTHPRTLAREIWEWDGERYRAGTYGDLLADARRAGASLAGGESRRATSLQGCSPTAPRRHARWSE